MVFRGSSLGDLISLFLPKMRPVTLLKGLPRERGEKMFLEVDLIWVLLSPPSKNLTAFLTKGNSEGVDSLLMIDSGLYWLDNLSSLLLIMFVLRFFWV